MITRWLRLALATVLLLVLQAPSIVGPPTAAADPVQDTTSTKDPIVVVMDTSSSMSENDASGNVKIDGARSAVLDLINALPSNARFGLIAYPGNSGTGPGGCPEGDVEIEVGPLSQTTASAAVRRLTPSGDTPTAEALTHAAEVIKAPGADGVSTRNGTIVLVSDGESNCGADVCETARQLSASGVQVAVNTVGFQISEEGAEELNCVADATGGKYVDAQDAEGLQNALQDLSGARLTLTASVPNPLPVVSGTGTSGPKAVVRVVNDGKKTATDVRLTLDFRDAGGRSGAVLVPRPILFLGNLEPGASRDVEMTIRPDSARLENFTWTVTATAGNALPKKVTGSTTTATPQLAGLLANVDRIAVVGDSYSSGQGAGDYREGTTGGEMAQNTCYRSANSYGYVLQKDSDRVDMIACGGATTAAFYEQQQSVESFGFGPKHWSTPQLLQLRALAVGPDSPDAVLLSIGGNDVDFGGTITTCVLGAPGQMCAWDMGIEEEQFKKDAATRIAAIGNDLRRVYRDVNRAVNDPEARERRDGKWAPIIVVPYPRILPTAQSGAEAADGCTVAINAREVAFLNDFLDMLNLEIFAAVGSLRSDDIPIFVASDVVNAFQPHHTICDGDSSYAVFAEDPAALISSQRVDINPDLFHPNKEGQNAMALAISTWAVGQTLKPGYAEQNWQHTVVRKLNALENAVAGVAFSPADIYLAGGDAQINADGFAPSSTVVIRVESTPRTLGMVATDNTGAVRAPIQLPGDIAPGTHHIRVLGFDASGMPREVVYPIRVAPPHTPAALVLVLVAVILTGVGAIGLLRNRKLRQTP